MEGEDGEEWRKFLCKDRIAHKVASCFGFEEGEMLKVDAGPCSILFMAKPTPVTYKL